jgi:hypothetical protein
MLQYNHNRIEVVRSPDIAAKYLKDPEVLSVAFVREPLARLLSMVSERNECRERCGFEQQQ